MKIILVATDARGRNVVFVSDTLRAYPLEEAVRLAHEGRFEHVYAVKGRNGDYLRTRKNILDKEQLEQLSISSRQLFHFANDVSHTVSNLALDQYLKIYERSLQEKADSPLIFIDGIGRVTKESVKERIQSNQDSIFNAAERFTVDPYLLTAIITDEIARFAPWELITDPLFGYYLSADASVGIAQVKIETARGLIRDGYYNPNPDDPNLSLENIGKTSRTNLYEYVKQPRHNISFAAARMRALIDQWRKFVDLRTMPAIIATLYSLPYKSPHNNPVANGRGLQIAEEFYSLAHEWLAR